ncbi:hypothetical protein AgCh_035779 [Apium graveolens]
MLADMVYVIRTTESLDRLLTVNKILNGGGSLSAELLKDAIQFFPRSKIISAYGGFSSSSPDFIYQSDVQLREMEEKMK